MKGLIELFLYALLAVLVAFVGAQIDIHAEQTGWIDYIR